MLLSHTFNQQQIDFEITYKKTKSFGIYLDGYGHLELRVPQDATEDQITKFIENNWELIKKEQGETKERLKGGKIRKYEEGETFLFLGKNYPLTIIENPLLENEKVIFDNSQLMIHIKNYEENLIKKLLTKFYKRQCRLLVMKSIKYYQSAFKIKPKSITIDNNPKAWGTCNSLRQLTFNWKLAMAPPNVIDYIVLHEMCHMVHLNHDRSFWRLVGKHIPNFEEYQNWLSHSMWKMIV